MLGVLKLANFDSLSFAVGVGGGVSGVSLCDMICQKCE
jgi:hypothetical protein